MEGKVSPAELEKIADWMVNELATSKEEYMAMKAKIQAKKRVTMFKMFDLNKDGVISQEEFDAVRSKMQQRQGQGKGCGNSGRCGQGNCNRQ